MAEILSTPSEFIILGLICVIFHGIGFYNIHDQEIDFEWLLIFIHLVFAILLIVGVALQAQVLIMVVTYYTIFLIVIDIIIIVMILIEADNDLTQSGYMQVPFAKKFKQETLRIVAIIMFIARVIFHIFVYIRLTGLPQ